MCLRIKIQNKFKFNFKTNNTIEDVDFSYNGFANEGALAIVMHSKSQLRLFLKKNLFQSECLKYNKTLNIIDLSCNRLTYESAENIAQALKINQTLRKLTVSFSYFK